jgi:hypothetical protein
VNIDNNGNFFGAAWNFEKGMVNFGGSTTPVATPNRDFVANCPNPSTCTTDNYCSACYNSQDLRLYGYGQVAGSGELIKLDSAQAPTPENYAQIKSWNAASGTPFYNTLRLPAGDFFGHASSTIAGNRSALSFNCLSENGDESSSTCEEDGGTRTYRVFIQNPEIGRMTAPNWPYSSACVPGNARGASLHWDLKSGIQAGYEIVVSTSDSYATSTATCWSGEKLGSTASNYSIPNGDDNLCTTIDSLNYNQKYYWFIRLFYTTDGINYTPTEWYQYGASDGHAGAIYDVDTNNPPDGDLKTFTTYRHEFPTPYFTWAPPDVLVHDTTTIFTALDPSQPSQAYHEFSSLPVDCDIYGCSYWWRTSDIHAIITASSSASTTIDFWRASGTSVTLRVTDDYNYFCEYTPPLIDINYGLPIWHEVKAE